MILGYDQQMQFIHRFIKKSFSNADEMRVKRIEELQPQQCIHFLDEFLSIEAGKELETTRLGYKPLESESYSSSELVLAPESQNINALNRKLSRSRLVYGPVDFYLESEEKPLEIPLITACAPNLMGSSRVDLRDFSYADKNDKSEEPKRILNTKAYEKECMKLADFIVGTVKKENKKRLIMPTFGVGAYIRQLNDVSKREAQRIMFTAFAKAAQKHEIDVDWVIQGKQGGRKEEVKSLISYAPDNSHINPIVQPDILQYVQNLVNQQKPIVLLNPGSDRTIGGKYSEKTIKDTLEEQYAQKSDLLFLQSVLNPSLVSRFEKDFALRKNAKAAQSVEGTSQISNPFPRNHLKSVAIKIKDLLNIRETPMVIQNNEHYDLSFKSIKSAQELNKLFQNKLNILNQRPYFIINLTPTQIQILWSRPIGALSEPNASLPPLMNPEEKRSPKKTKNSFQAIPEIPASDDRANPVPATPAQKQDLGTKIEKPDVVEEPESKGENNNSGMQSNSLTNSSHSKPKSPSNDSPVVVQSTPKSEPRNTNAEQNEPRIAPEHPPKATPAPSFFNPNLKNIAEKIQSRLNLQETPRVSKNHEDFKVSFKHKASAEKLNQLFKHNNLPIHHEKTYFVVHLSAAQVQDLWSAPKTNVDNKKDPVIQLIAALTTYEDKRKAFVGPNPEYKVTFFGFGFGYSKTQKLAATEALKNSLMGGNDNIHAHLGALKNGELGTTINNFLKHNKLFADASIKNVAELVDYLQSQAANIPTKRS